MSVGRRTDKENEVHIQNEIPFRYKETGNNNCGKIESDVVLVVLSGISQIEKIKKTNTMFSYHI